MRALVVDDSKPSRSIVSRALRDLAFECAEATNGAEALAALAAGGTPDLVTVNWHMPVMDGLELIRRLRGDPATRKLPLVMISTEHDRARIAEALAAGADDYLSKPFTPEALARKLVALGVCRERAAGAGTRPLRVLICDDSATIRGILSTTLASDPGVRVTGAAVNGQVCLDMLATGELPDVVLLDVEMPVMDGLTALREIRRRHPRLPVVMFSSLTERGARATVDALVAGANDYVAKPVGLDPGEVAARIRGEVLGRIKQVVSRGQLTQATTATAGSAAPAMPRPAVRQPAVAGVVIAVSTGGPAALAEVLPACVLAARVPILIVQHMPATFTGRLAERLTAVCGRPVREASDGLPVTSDAVLLAPGGRHMELAGTAVTPRIRLTDAPPENSCRPAADVLFRSAARIWGGATLGVVLTGMGRDGLAGSRVVVEAGGGVIAQDEFSSVVWGMPGEVVRAGLADVVLPLGQIGPEIALRLERRPGERRATTP
ncbi:MAG: chemotaxis-specific protein-glutamate methyltransferase CheB [Planctomycetes bacterium]|nr:chemotaxis-specific protein-glutamate methyltransferase CheB [Planctomycetota bacterium]